MIGVYQERPQPEAAVSAGWLVVYAFPEDGGLAAVSPIYEAAAQAEAAVDFLRARGHAPGEFFAAQLWRLP